MARSAPGRLVVAVSSGALFDLTEAETVYQRDGLEAYRAYQREREGEPLPPGRAYSFVRRFLGLNAAAPGSDVVEVVLFSRNDHDTGLRVFNSIEHFGLPITRAVFTGGESPYRYFDTFQARLFLSTCAAHVQEAMALGYPAGRIYAPSCDREAAAEEEELRVAFDFDGILAGDEGEAVYKAQGLDAFCRNEVEKGDAALDPGPLQPLLEGFATIQTLERQRSESEPGYEPRLRTAIVTARAAPAHRRLVASLRSWDLHVDETLFLGGLDKGPALSIYRPHLFFDDQRAHVESVRQWVPAVHVPFGVANRRAARA